MARESIGKMKPGTKAVSIALEPNTDFKTIVAYLEKVLVVPKLPGIGGCDPCLSGLDRIVIDSTILPQVR